MLLQFVPPNMNCYCQPPQNASLNLCMAHEASTIMNQQKQTKKSTFFVHAFVRPQWAQWKLSEGSVGLRFIFTYSIISSNIICLSVKFLYVHTRLCALVRPAVRDRVRTKMERDILADVNHPFVVKLHYGESARSFSLRFPSLGKKNWFHDCLIALNSRNFPLSCFLIYCWIGFDWNSCICSIPDWGEVVLDPRLSQRRRSLHETLQRGESSPLDFAVLLAYGQTGIHLIIPYYLALVMLSFLTVSLFLTLLSVCLHALPGDVHRGRCEVLSSRAGIRAGPPP